MKTIYLKTTTPKAQIMLKGENSIEVYENEICTGELYSEDFFRTSFEATDSTKEDFETALKAFQEKLTTITNL